MRRSSSTLLAFACLSALAGQTSAATLDHTELTLYRSDDSGLFSADNSGAINAGFAVAREPRSLELKAGTQLLSLNGLPQFLDTEGLSLSVDGAKVLSQQLRLDQSQSAGLSGMVGKHVVLGGPGQSADNGVLLAVDHGSLLIKADNGDVRWVPSTGYNYVSVREQQYGASGAILDLRLQAERNGQAKAILSYPTAGLGWRASYVGHLEEGANCKLAIESRASIANRSGRDWNNVKLSLVAGEMNFDKPSGPRPMMMMAKAARAPAPTGDAMPVQSNLSSTARTYTLPSAIDLPDGSVTLTPLYGDHTVDCEQTALFENGGSWMPSQPMTGRDFTGGSNDHIVSTLHFVAFDSMPAGYLRVLTNDRDGTPQYIGQIRIDDKAKGQDVDLTLGNAFDLDAKRERTAFTVDKAAHAMDESFRINLGNAGDKARVVTVREHPNRWTEWKLTSSSIKPSKSSSDTLEFKVDVPAHGKATLEYSVRYTWAADVTPQ